MAIIGRPITTKIRHITATIGRITATTRRIIWLSPFSSSCNRPNAETTICRDWRSSFYSMAKLRQGNRVWSDEARRGDAPTPSAKTPHGWPRLGSRATRLRSSGMGERPDFRLARRLANEATPHQKVNYSLAPSGSIGGALGVVVGAASPAVAGGAASGLIGRNEPGV